MTYTLHTIRPARGSRRSKRRIGRGNASGMGTYATRGLKGQRARTGGRSGLRHKGMKRIIEALPKIGGFVSKRKKPRAVSLERVAERFPNGARITLQALSLNGLIAPHERAAKVIGNNTRAKQLHFVGISASEAARRAVRASGGSFEEKGAKTV